MNLEMAYKLQKVGLGRVWSTHDESKQRLYIDDAVSMFIAKKLGVYHMITLNMFYDIKDGVLKNTTNQSFNKKVNQDDTKNIVTKLLLLFVEYEGKEIYSLRSKNKQVCNSVLHFVGEDKDKLYWKD